MNLGNERESPNFQDMTLGDWVRTPMGRNLWHQMLKTGAFPDAIRGRGAPGGYTDWLRNALSTLTPQDYAMMRASGLNIEDIGRLHDFLDNGNIDPTVYPYSDATANAAVKRMRNAR